MTDQLKPALPARRTLVKGAAWAAPAVSLAAAAPTLAASSPPLRKDPGLNGWVLNRPTDRGGCRWYLEVDSTVTNMATPDGAPFGLYLYDVDPNAVITEPVITYWIIGNQDASWSNLAGHSSCWQYQGRGALTTKADGLQYRPYTWRYTCAVNPSSVSPDGRLRLGNFHVRASFTQPSNRCSDVTYWTQRTITIDPYGDGDAEVLTFERRNGTRGTYGGSAQRMAPQGGPASDGPALA